MLDAMRIMTDIFRMPLLDFLRQDADVLFLRRVRLESERIEVVAGIEHADMPDIVLDARIAHAHQHRSHRPQHIQSAAAEQRRAAENAAQERWPERLLLRRGLCATSLRFRAKPGDRQYLP